MKLEIIAFNIASCTTIQESGCHRVELCDNSAEGGTTPSHGFIQAAREKLSIELYPMIRPRGGDFLYSEAEFKIMKKDILYCRSVGCDGIVVGILEANGTIDKNRCNQLVKLAYPMGVTFHRAFDRVVDAEIALEDVIDTGCERILSSGLRPNAIEGASTLAELVKQADGRIIIMPGSGIRADNILEIANQTGASEFHSSARLVLPDQMIYHNPFLNETLSTIGVDENEICTMLGLLNERQASLNSYS